MNAKTSLDDVDAKFANAEVAEIVDYDVHSSEIPEDKTEDEIVDEWSFQIKSNTEDRLRWGEADIEDVDGDLVKVYAIGTGSRYTVRIDHTPESLQENITKITDLPEDFPVQDVPHKKFGEEIDDDIYSRLADNNDDLDVVFRTEVTQHPHSEPVGATVTIYELNDGRWLSVYEDANKYYYNLLPETKDDNIPSELGWEWHNFMEEHLECINDNVTIIHENKYEVEIPYTN